MAWTNYHNHCHYCDGKMPVEDHVKEAIKNGLIAIGFSSHCPVDFPNNWSMAYKDVSDYISEINDVKEKYMDSIEVYKSLEIDFIPEIVSPADPLIKSLNLDYSIGSVHFVGAFDNNAPWEIDGTTSLFEKGLLEIHDNDIKKVVKGYFELTRQMVEQTNPDIIGHLDKIKMHNFKKPFFDENEAWYKEEVIQTLETIHASEGIIEVNTRGLYKKYTTKPYPSYWVLEEIKKRNIPICINSDAHHPKEITEGFSETARHLLKLGFSTLRIFTSNKWQDVPFNECGIILN